MCVRTRWRRPECISRGANIRYAFSIFYFLKTFQRTVFHNFFEFILVTAYGEHDDRPNRVETFDIQTSTPSLILILRTRRVFIFFLDVFQVSDRSRVMNNRTRCTGPISRYRLSNKTNTTLYALKRFFTVGRRIHTRFVADETFDAYDRYGFRVFYGRRKQTCFKN